MQAGYRIVRCMHAHCRLPNLIPALRQQPNNVKVILVCVTPRASVITEAVVRCVTLTATSWRSLIECHTIVDSDSMNSIKNWRK